MIVCYLFTHYLVKPDTEFYTLLPTLFFDGILFIISLYVFRTFLLK